MSCQRCGGLLAVELAKAMSGLVCRMAVIESRHCHCADIEDSEQTNLSREAVGTFTWESPKITTLEGGPQ